MESQLTIDHCQISNNGFGVFSDDFAHVRVANSTITDNLVGLHIATSGQIFSRISGDPANPVKTNTLENNATPGAFTGTHTAQ